MTALAECQSSPSARIVIGAITVYQKVISPVLGPRCRFFPSCSEYAKQCFGKYPLPLAAKRTAGRLARCHPFHPGGVDLP